MFVPSASPSSSNQPLTPVDLISLFLCYEPFLSLPLPFFSSTLPTFYVWSTLLASLLATTLNLAMQVRHCTMLKVPFHDSSQLVEDTTHIIICSGSISYVTLFLPLSNLGHPCERHNGPCHSPKFLASHNLPGQILIPSIV